MIDKMQQGQNKLGSILQEIRQAITAESEVSLWLKSQFNLLSIDRKDMPTITLEVFKEGENIETITLQGKAVFIFGRNQ